MSPAETLTPPKQKLTGQKVVGAFVELYQNFQTTLQQDSTEQPAIEPTDMQWSTKKAQNILQPQLMEVVDAIHQDLMFELGEQSNLPDIRISARTENQQAGSSIRALKDGTIVDRIVGKVMRINPVNQTLYLRNADQEVYEVDVVNPQTGAPNIEMAIEGVDFSAEN